MFNIKLVDLSKSFPTSQRSLKLEYCILRYDFSKINPVVQLLFTKNFLMKSANGMPSSVLCMNSIEVGTPFADFANYTLASAKYVEVRKWTVDFFTRLLQC